MNEQLKKLKDTKEQRIFNALQNRLDYMKENYPSLNIIAIYLQGSQNYDLDDEYSDIDAIAICLPSLDDLITKNGKESFTYIMNDNSHVEVKDIRLLQTLLYKQHPKYLELLETKYALYVTAEGKLLKNAINKYKNEYLETSLQLVRAMIHMFNNKLDLSYKKRQGNINEFQKFKLDVKSLSHFYRIGYMLEELINGKKINELYILSKKQREFILNIKRGKHIPSKQERDNFQEYINKLVDNYIKGNEKLNYSSISKETTDNLKKELNNIIKYTIYHEFVETFNDIYYPNSNIITVSNALKQTQEKLLKK